MRVEHFRAHAAYCLGRMHAAPDAASRRRWESECADWLDLELGASRPARTEAAPSELPTAWREGRSFR